MATVDVSPRLRAGSPALRRLSFAMLAAGVSAFALLYATQALLPDLADDFGVGATAASLTVAVSTGVLALTVLPMSALAERLGRTRVMTAGLTAASVSVLVAAAAPSFGVLLALRAVDGLALGAVVAVAVGHIGSVVEPEAAGPAIGIYVSGTTLGGLVGRLVPAGVVDLASWRWAMVALAVLGAAATVVFARLAGPSAVPAASPDEARGAVATHLRDAGIVRLCGVALLLMGGFVATYNYLTFRLGEAPFDLPVALAGLVFLAYLAGTVSSTVAARLVVRHGRRRVLLVSVAVSLAGLAVTLASSLPAVVAGLVVFTTGFFGAHAVASAWTSARAVTHKSQAAALYLTAYYVGSSVGGTVIGFAWSSGGWAATVAAVAACFLAAAALAAGVRDEPV